MRNVQTNIGIDAADDNDLWQTFGSRNIQCNCIFQFIICDKWRKNGGMLFALFNQSFTQVHAEIIKRNND